MINNAQVISQSDSIRILMKELRYHEKEFLLHESIDSNFYIHRESVNLKSAEQAFQQIQQLCQKLRNITYLSNDTLSDLIDPLEAQLDGFMHNYRLLVREQQKRGFKNWGLVGLLRDKIHQVEDAQLDYDQSYLLMLRRHEKDFFLRKDDKYLDQKFKPAVQKCLRHLATKENSENAALVKSLVLKVKAYQEVLFKVRDLDRNIGYNQFSGIQGKLHAYSEGIQQQVQVLHQWIGKNSAGMILKARVYFGLAFGIQFVLLMILGFRFLNRLTNRLSQMRQMIQKLAGGQLIPEITCNQGDEISDNFIALNSLNQRIKQATYFTQKIVAQKLEVDYSPDFKKGVLEKALLHMQKALKQANQEKQINNWLDKNLAQFIDVFKKHQELIPLSQDVILRLAKQVKAQQGAIFLSKEIEGQPMLVLAAGYALSRERYQNRQIMAEEGLIGQAAKNRKSIYLDQLPENFKWIDPGTGNVRPQSIFICPIQINDEALGVIELSSAYSFEVHHQQMVEKIADYMAWFIIRKNVQVKV